MSAKALPEAAIDVEALKPGFRCLYLQRVSQEKNQARFYLLSWQPTLFGWAVVRSYGRIGCWQRAMPPLSFDSLEQAWPLLRTIIKRRLRHGYQVMELTRV
jgi:predicted DNA-binding WGR domain protein